MRVFDDEYPCDRCCRTAPTDVGYLLVVVVITISSMIVVIPVMALIRMVIVFNAAAVSFPIPRIISFAVVAWCNPVSSLIRRSSPIAFMPLVMIPHGIPITLHPHVVRVWPCRHNDNGPGRRWRRNYDSDGNLRVNCRASG